MSQSESHPHADLKTSPDHELTPMESFFDTLFNHHMVLPQTPEDAAPIEGVDGQELARDDHRGR